MEEKRTCKIVQDLLPNYIEVLTNKETNKFVEEHLNECTECKQILENMKKEVELNKTEREEKEVKFIKKYNRKLKILRNILLIILVIVLIYLGNTLRKFFIIKDLQHKAEENLKSTNYQLRIIAPWGQDYYYKKDNKTADFSYSRDNTTEMLNYNNNGVVHTFIQTPEEKKAIIYSEKMPSEANSQYYVIEEANNDFELFLICSKIKIKKDNFNGKKCYVIDNSSYVINYDNRYQKYIEMETGLVIKELDRNRSMQYIYQFNNVDDLIFEEPDINEYEVVYR